MRTAAAQESRQSDGVPASLRHGRTGLRGRIALRGVARRSRKGYGGREIFYSVDTVRRFRREAAHRGDHLYFLLGADSFLHIREWRTPAELLTLCDFIVASRPGFPSAALQRAVPKELRTEPGERGAAFTLHRGRGSIAGTSVYLLDTVASHVSATEVRWRLDNARSIRGLVPARVEDYINQQGLYQR